MRVLLGPAAAVSCFITAWAGCGSNLPADPSLIPRASWGVELAAVECRQIFGCCDTTERMHFGYTDEAQCRSMLAPEMQKALDQVVDLGWVAYDGKAARRCLDESTATACLNIHANASVGIAGPSCPSVTRGLGQLGAVCEDLDFVCASSNCLASSGKCGPPRGCALPCADGQYCDPATSVCAPAKADGAACADNSECAPALVCRARACGAPLPDGSACSSSSDCANGSCVHTGLATASCGPLLPDGAPCQLTSDCANDGCTMNAAGQSVCGPRFCDGV